MLQSPSRVQLLSVHNRGGLLHACGENIEPDINNLVPHEVGLAAARNSVSLHSPNASEMLACIGLGQGCCVVCT